ncbi:MAG TPA: DUF190 domain-containing protein [Gaiellaceae bacterium]|nr:DUF190 domain-containing protein [Gaiellaceae bacterium]
MTGASLKLTAYFGESDRVGRRLLSDVLLDLFERHEVHAAVLLRGVEGFGSAQSLRTDRFLTLSEDLPLVAIAVDDRARIERLVPRVTELVAGGLVTLERARLLHDGLAGAGGAPHETVKLTLYLGRDERVDGRPAFVDVVESLRRAGVDGATVLLGVDGMAHRRRRRARFLSRNDDVPLLVVAIGGGAAVARALPAIGARLTDPIATLERVRVLKRDGRRLGELAVTGGGAWQKLTVVAGEHARHGRHPLSVELVRRLRAAGASGATSVRGVFGFSGEHAPHGDRLFRVRRRVPVLTTILDHPERMRRWFDVVDEVTAEAGLVTSEIVPAFDVRIPPDE